MKTALLQTKLYIPPLRPNLVPRPHLIERLNAGWHRKLTLVSAPAGFGKTTLLSEWVADCGRSVAWLSLDEGDNDPARFLAYLVAALQTVEPDVGAGVLAALQSPQPPPVEAILTALINDIAAVSQGDHKGRPYVLVLDDYHLVAARPIYDALAFLLEHLPPQMHLVIATRADPPLPLARLRARNQLTELRAADLRFTSDETVAFLNDAMGLGLLAADIAALESRTEGWIAGLQMAALSMQGRQDIAGFIQAFNGSHRFVLDYLVEEVLDRQPHDIQEFLLKTSILERMTASLCDAVTDRDDSQPILARLEQDDLFLVPLDDERRWYRYHRLFADLLRSRLGQAQPDRVPELHRRASAWFEDNGLTTEAVHHALVSRDVERAARLVEENAMPMLMRGELTTLLGWLADLPGEKVRSRPWLCIHQAWALLLTGQLEAIELHLQAAERVVGETPPPDAVLGHVAAIRAYAAAMKGDTLRATGLAHEALDRLPEEELAVRGVVAFTLGGASLLEGNVAGANRAFGEASAIGQAGGNIHLAVPATCSLAVLQAVQGQLHRANETYRKALQMASGRAGRPLPVAAGAYSGMGELLYEWNDLETSTRDLTQGIELGKQWGNVDTLTSSYVALARVRQAQGDLDGAHDALQEADQLVRDHSVTPTTVTRVAAYWPRLWLAQGNVMAASRWAQEHDLSMDDKLSYLRELEYISLAQVLMAQDEPGEALRLLARLLQAAETGGRTGCAIEILALQALTFQMQDDTAQAMTLLERALSLAEPEGYVRTFVDQGKPMARLLRCALSQGIAPNYVARLLAAFGQAVELPSPAMESLVEPLSERELEVLRLVVAGLSNSEIADELFIAVSTVKSHINHIYGKLGVENRTQAVARARELNLL